MLRTLPRKITVLSLVLAVFSLASWQYWVSSDTSNTLRRQKIQDMGRLLDRTADYLNLYAEGLNSALLNLADALEVIGDDSGQLHQALDAFRLSNPGKILSATYMLTPDRVYSTKQAAFDIFGSQPLQAIFEEVNASRYRGIRWTEPYSSSLALANTVAYYKPIVLPDSTGVLILEINLHNMLSDLLQADRASSVSWAVVSSGRAVVSTSSDSSTFVRQDPALLSREALEAGMDTLVLEGQSMYTIDYNNQTYLVMQEAPVCFGWHLLALVRESDLYASVTPMVRRTFLMGVLHMMALILLVVFLTQGVMRPISVIARKLQQTADPLTLSFRRYEKRRDEAGVLARSLSVMIANIKALMEQQENLLAQKHKLELVMLQGQIHPHFLGNTLACILSLTKEKAYQSAQESLHALIQLMNYSIARTDAMVSLREELACIDAYVALRQIRMQRPFAYHAFVVGQHMQQQVPRLFLQPIIENAVTHGLSHMAEEGSITVTSYEQRGKLFLCVENSGPHASAEHLAKVTKGSVDPSPHAHGIGVNNVFQRLRLACKQSEESRLEPLDQGGVRVTLDLGILNSK